MNREQLVHVRTTPRSPVHREPEIPETFERFRLGGAERLVRFTPAIGEEPKRSRRGHCRIELPQAACGGIAGVREGAGALHGLPRVEFGEVLMAHVDFAAHFQHSGCIRQLGGNVRQGRSVGGDHLAYLSVSAGRRDHQCAVLVAQRERKPIDLRLRGEGQFVLLVDPEIAPDPGNELFNVCPVERVGE